MKQIRRVLLATDFSPTARTAFEWALGVARAADAELEVLHVWQPTLDLALATPTIDGRGKTLSEVVRKQAQKTMAAWVGSEACRSRVELGAPAEIIVTLAQTDDYDLIVIGATGVGDALSRLGSVALRVLGTAPCAVIVLPDKRNAALSERQAEVPS
jgi:universal stress protein A